MSYFEYTKRDVMLAAAKAGDKSYVAGAKSFGTGLILAIQSTGAQRWDTELLVAFIREGIDRIVENDPNITVFIEAMASQILDDL